MSQYKLNLPTDLKNRLQEAANRSGRSLSSEIITRLEASIAISDDGGLDFTLDAIENFIVEAVISQTEDLEARVKMLERFVDTTDYLNDD
ncbi:Arc family DNA-binding protein [Thioclava sp. NG1]|uniref:Arc family DNA-binding protein n=1 Tax=Thioclava sp. NG1 TaxID=2182426 RepID=UPI0013048A79|nr:Arc family DNA-binding protein [Thioclava sp. NG1]